MASGWFILIPIGLVSLLAVWIVAESVSYRISMNRYHIGD